MPDYRYRCDKCEVTEDRVNVKIKDRDSQICHKCLEPLRKLVCFKGSVWAPTAGGMR